MVDERLVVLPTDLAGRERPERQAPGASGQRLGDSAICQIVRRTREQQLASCPVQVGASLHGEEEALAGTLELVDHRRARQALDEGHGVVRRARQCGAVVHREPVLGRDAEQVLSQRRLADLTSSTDHDDSENSEHLVDPAGEVSCERVTKVDSLLTGKTQ
nr:hypothetical protein [Haloactinopolyspora alba]